MDTIPTHLPRGDTSNQLRVNDAHDELRAGVLRVFAFGACLLMAIGWFALATKYFSDGWRVLGLALSGLAAIGCLWLAAGFAVRAFRRFRAGRKLVLFHNRAASR